MKRTAFHPPPIDAQAPPRLPARLPTVLHATGLGRSTLYRLIAAGFFPAPIRLGARAVAWRWEDIDHWSCCRPKHESVSRFASRRLPSSGRVITWRAPDASAPLTRHAALTR